MQGVAVGNRALLREQSGIGRLAIADWIFPIRFFVGSGRRAFNGFLPNVEGDGVFFKEKATRPLAFSGNASILVLVLFKGMERLTTNNQTEKAL